jgi:hypothetical protein
MTLQQAKDKLKLIAQARGVQPADLRTYQAALDSHLPGQPWPPPPSPPPNTGSCTYAIDGIPNPVCVNGVTENECTVTLGGTFSNNPCP